MDPDNDWAGQQGVHGAVRGGVVHDERRPGEVPSPRTGAASSERTHSGRSPTTPPVSPICASPGASHGESCRREADSAHHAPRPWLDWRRSAGVAI